MHTLKWLLIGVLLGYGGIVALMYVFQRSMMYVPDTVRTPPAKAGFPQAQEVTLTSSDGEKLIAWYVPPRDEKPLVLYFQGNGGALKLRVRRFAWVTDAGYGLLALSYRGYGGSTGRPTEQGLIRDARAAYGFAIAHYPARRIVLWGESLGTAVAVALAAERPVGGLILDAPFTSAEDIAATAFPFMPVRRLIKDPFYSDRRIGQVHAPILIVHGERDAVVLIRFGERLFALANEPKRMVRLPDAGHEDLDGHGEVAAVKEFLAALPR